MVGDTGTGGTKGAVPAPASGDTAAGRFLKADGSWAVPPGGGGGTPGSPSTSVQFNDGGAFAGDANMEFNKTTHVLTLGVLPALPTQTANTVWSGPTTGAAAAPTFRTLVAADLPTVPIAGGGTGQTTKAAAFDALQPMSAVGDLVYGGTAGTGTRLAGNTSTTKNFLTQTGSGAAANAPAWGTVAVADVSGAAADSAVVHLTGNESISGAKTFSTVPTLPTQTANTIFAGPTTGAAAAPTFRAQVVADLPTVDIAHGGTGQTTKAPAFDALSPMTTAGDLIYGGASGTGTRFAPNATATKNFLTMTSSTPAWGTIAVGDVSGAAPLASPSFTGSTLTLADAQNVVVGASSGTKIGTATTQKLGFFNQGPVVQPSGDILTALGTSSGLGLVASPTISEADVTNLTTDLAAKAPLASPAFTGTPTTATSPTDADSSTKLATTAFVMRGLIMYDLSLLTLCGAL